MGPARGYRKPHRCRGEYRRRHWRIARTPDGYTLLSSPPPPLVINQNLYPNLAFDPMKFEPIIVIAQVPNSIIVNPTKINATTVPELIAYLKANPGQGHLRDPG